METNKFVDLVCDQVASELKRRKKENQQYSLRAFARDLKLNPTFLSQVIRGQARFSLERGMSCLQAMGIDPGLFLGGDAGSSRSTAKNSGDHMTLCLDAFRIIADWHHYAILELTFCTDFQSDARWIARRLGITQAEVTDAVDRLISLALLERTPTGALRKTKNYLATPSDIPSRFLRSHHKQMLEKAKLAIEAQSVDEREFGSLTFAVNPKQVPLLKEAIRRFRKRIAQTMASSIGMDPTEVYQLNVNLFRLTEHTEKEG